MKPGIRTTEFWVTVLGNLAAVLAIVWPGHDYSGLVPVLAIACGMAANIAYGVGRHTLKAATLRADGEALVVAAATTPATAGLVAKAEKAAIGVVESAVEAVVAKPATVTATIVHTDGPTDAASIPAPAAPTA